MNRCQSLFMELNLNKVSLKHYYSKLSYKDLIIFLIPVIIFSYYLWVFDPGILRYDSFNQFHQIASHHFTNWHPFFHTFIEMVLLKIYPSPVSVCIFQILTFSVIWMMICNHFRYEGENANGISRLFIVQVLFTLIICLIPINAVFSITLLKDILFGYYFLLFTFLIAVLLDKKGEVRTEFLIIMPLVMAFIVGLRPNGFHIIVISLIILTAYFFRKKYNLKTIVIIVSLTVVFILLIASLNVAFDVTNNQKAPIYAKASHMLADYDLNLTLTPQDSTALHKLMNESTIKDNYQITFSDPMYFMSNKSVFDHDKSTYRDMAIKYSIQNPDHFIKYLFCASPIVWDVTRDDSWVGEQYYVNLELDKDRYFSNHPTFNMTDFENVSSKNIGTSQFDSLNNYVEMFKHNLILDSLFNSPAFYMYLSFILVGAIYLITRSKEIFMIYLPNLINIAIIFFSTPIQDNRYLYPNLLVAYFLIIMLIGIIAKKKLNNEKIIEFNRN